MSPGRSTSTEHVGAYRLKRRCMRPLRCGQLLGLAVRSHIGQECVRLLMRSGKVDRLRTLACVTSAQGCRITARHCAVKLGLCVGELYCNVCIRTRTARALMRTRMHGGACACAVRALGGGSFGFHARPKPLCSARTARNHARTLSLPTVNHTALSEYAPVPRLIDCGCATSRRLFDMSVQH